MPGGYPQLSPSRVHGRALHGINANLTPLTRYNPPGVSASVHNSHCVSAVDTTDDVGTDRAGTGGTEQSRGPPVELHRARAQLP